MNGARKWLWVYKVVRSVLFTAVVFFGAVFITLYILLSMPGVQRKIKNVAERELSALVDSRVKIGRVLIYPFNEVVVRNVELYEPGTDSIKCLHVDKVGAGISLWKLFIDRRVVITYAELMGMWAEISQDEQGGPLNIQFLIDAFAPKDKNKPPAKFDLEIRNIVIRKSAATFDRKWSQRRTGGTLDPNHLAVRSLNADLAFPRLSNDDVEIDLRRIAFILDPGLEVRRISCFASIKNGDISVNDLILRLPNSRISFSDISLPLSRHSGDFGRMLREGEFGVQVRGENITPAEFACIYQPLEILQTPYTLNLDAQGNAGKILINVLGISNPYEEFNLLLRNSSLRIEGGRLTDLSFNDFDLHAGAPALQDLTSILADKVNGKVGEIIKNSGHIDISAEGQGELLSKNGVAKVSLNTGYGNMLLESSVTSVGEMLKIAGGLDTESLDLGRLTGDERFGEMALNLKGGITLNPGVAGSGRNTGIDPVDRINALLPEGSVEIRVPSMVYSGHIFNDINIGLSKTPASTLMHASCEDPLLNFDLNAELQPRGEESQLNLDLLASEIYPGIFSAHGKWSEYAYSGSLDVELHGNRPDNMSGRINVSDLKADASGTGRDISLDHMVLNAVMNNAGGRCYTLESDWINGEVTGNFTPTQLPDIVKRLCTGLLTGNERQGIDKLPDTDMNFHFTVDRDGSWSEMFNLPLKLLTDAEVSGGINTDSDFIEFNLSAPYIRQGRDKLIRGTNLSANINEGKGSVKFFSSIPTKKGVLDLDADMLLKDGDIDLLLGFNREKRGGFYGELNIDTQIIDALNPQGRLINARILPGELWLNGACWKIGESSIRYADKEVSVAGFSITHDDQYITIGGVASADKDREMLVNLKDIDLDYIFDTLNIEYVAFGGLATGQAVGKGLLSGSPEAFTRTLNVRNLSYNHSVLGDGEITGTFDPAVKRVGIKAAVAEDGRPVADIDGGIWIGRDSLSFDINADKVRVGFLQSFMKAFSSEVDGRASGNALLYGTFKDIDMKGRLFADTIRLKVDYTNVCYSGRDSVYIDPGNITIPSFRLYDDHGHSAMLRGNLTHNYFHDPEFRFFVTDVRDMLVYDTDASMNPIWYGKGYGSGGAEINGKPGYVGILVDMTTRPGSTFSFVLSDQQEAQEYNFLTFTDHRKEERERREAAERAEHSSADAIVEAFKKQVAESVASESVFGMDIRATVTPGTLLTLVMDPVAGDKITARGEGAMNMTYNSESDDLRMYGKYTLQEGVYNFSLQDVILKDFVIRPGSSISFNGDPMNGILNIRAAYRVNTNLTDLDKSFATDRDLNRTNVPVDAMLIVDGEMTQPDITFDIELPTLNDEVTQKVRSIISSEDMMNKQIIYLLALNRFYTPEYMGVSSSGGEWASVASSTLSSQLTSILGQLTDKVNIAPSVRSDKGDFSDLEVDLALSSRLFNNRLLINGNFGYRDRNTSSTTFIGDFDIEYLLHRNGNFRLKAYNHFNDQNYYLKSSLTTQGIGVIYRKDFNRLFHRRKKRRISLPPDSPQPADSIKVKR